MGRDLLAVYRITDGRHEDLDVVAEQSVGGIDNAVQSVVHRIKTVAGELADLGHPEYGSRHHELIGEPNVDRTRHLIKLYVLQALRDEPRVEKVLSVSVAPEHRPPRETVRIELALRVQGEPTVLNLVLPFSLGVTP
jgi:phage baseplate assembly protein W